MSQPLDQAGIERHLALRRKKRIAFGDVEVLVVELTAGEVSDLWDAVTTAEREGRQIDAYLAYCRAGVRTMAGQPLFLDPEALHTTPVRVISQLAEAILELSGMSSDVEKTMGDHGEMSPID